jgi:hypothetical protein
MNIEKIINRAIYILLAIGIVFVFIIWIATIIENPVGGV